MRIKNLGRTGLKVSEVCMGTMTFGGQADEAASHVILDHALDAGVNFVDLSDIYPIPPSLDKVGISEEIVGRWLRGKRHRVVVATKCRGLTGPYPNDQGLSRRHILGAVDASLRRLQTDYIDLYQTHWPDVETPIEETLRAFDDLVRVGKVLYVGCSNCEAWRLSKSLWTSERLGLARFDCLQVRYNLLSREVERELVPLCLEEGTGLIVYSPLAGGFLTGKYVRGQEPPSGTRFTLPGPTQSMRARYWSDRFFDAIDTVRRIADRVGAMPSQIALSWVLRRPAVTSAIVGATSPAQLEESLKGVDVELSDEAMSELDALAPPWP